MKALGLLIKRPTEPQLERFLDQQRRAAFTYPEVGATSGSFPRGYWINEWSQRLGYGLELYRNALAALNQWRMTQVGWLEVYPTQRVEPGATVAVMVHCAGLWSLNACRVAYCEHDST